MAYAQTSAAVPAGDVLLRVYAAGSLREPLTEVARLYEAGTGIKTELNFGASGLLRERIEKGEPAQVFASADMQHPGKLAASDPRWQQPVRMVRNQMCALVSPVAQVRSDNLLTRMLSPSIQVGTSSPGSDPAGDYAWALFRRAEAVLPGAYAVLDAKALRLTGAAGTPQPPAGRGTYAWLMDEGRADIFLTYCTNAIASRQEVSRLQVVAVPPALAVAADYGLSARRDDVAALQFAQYLLSPAAQGVFIAYGFGAP